LLSAKSVEFNRVGNEVTGEYAVDPEKVLEHHALSKRKHKMLWL